ncbi:hypothetical protein KI387_035698, partial [Taxus chinensis]
NSSPQNGFTQWTGQGGHIGIGIALHSKIPRHVFVHGGGPKINEWLVRVGIRPQFKNGLRVTDAPTMEVVEMLLVSKVNKSLVSLITTVGEMLWDLWEGWETYCCKV